MEVSLGKRVSVPCLEWGYPATPWVVKGGAGDCSGCGGLCEPGESFEAGVGSRCLSAVRADGCRSFGSHLEAPWCRTLVSGLVPTEKASGLGGTPRHGRVPSPPNPALWLEDARDVAADTGCLFPSNVAGAQSWAGMGDPTPTCRWPLPESPWGGSGCVQGRPCHSSSPRCGWG